MLFNVFTERPLFHFQHTTYGNSGSSASSLKGDSERDFFVELWDVSGHERYKDCRSLFYSQINGE
jgi:Rab-like protein 3